MYRYIITLLMFCCLTTQAFATDVQLQPNHPERYVVVKGDTLWGISARFLKDPWLWPKVWKMNRAQIKNPHWIYPGDVVILDTSSGNPELRLLRETITLQPGVRVEELEKQAIPTIAPNIIAPFLSQPLVIEEDQLAGAPTIVGAQENHVVLSPGVKIYVDKLNEEDGLLWNVYRPGKPLIDPDTKQVLGIEAIYLGDARVSQYGEPATAEIVRSKEEIFTKDKLAKAPDTLLSSFVPHAPDGQVQGRLLSIYGGVAEGGPNSIVTINRGSAEGIEDGHVLAIYRYGETIPKLVAEKKSDENRLKEVNFETSRNADGKLEINFPKEDEASKTIKLPDERIGLLMVFRTFEHVSYALVMQANQPVNVLDLVQTP